MSAPHRATEEQWEIVEICREQGHTPWPTATCLLELRSRVEALEKVIRVITGSLTPAEQAELGVVSVKDLQADLRSIAFEAMKAAQEAATEADNATAATVAEIRSLLFKDATQPEPAPDAPAAPKGLPKERLARIIEPGDLLGGLTLRDVVEWLREQLDAPETAAALEKEATQ